MSKTTQPSILQALVPILFLVLLLGINVVYFGEDSSYGPNQVALLLAAGVATIVGLSNKVSWDTIFDGIVDSLTSAMGAIIILLLIGALAGTWLMSGIVPAMIYYGLQFLNPTIFLFAACIVCAIVSLATGSSWSTVATVGIALMGIGMALGISEGWVAGAVISGAYFGDKMSPLSDTTNLAPAVAGSDLFTHIRHMFWTTGPSIVIALIIFLLAGFFFSGNTDDQQVELLLTAITEKFNVSPLLFLVPALVIILIIKKVPAIPALLIGSLLGGVAAVIFQPAVVREIAGLEGGSYVKASYTAIINAMALETSISTSNASVDKLLSAKGMFGMMNTVWLIICALSFGGAMYATQLLQRITQAILKMVNSVGSLILATSGTCIFFNLTASDQYLAIVVPGKMYSDAFRDRGLAPENLSRTLEDSGTVTSVLIPWNTCGVAQSAVLGVATMTYLPYCFFNILSPLMTVLFGYMGWKITPLKPSANEEPQVAKA
ncbi:MAG: NhaC family Na+:H+ antiporter [Litorivivens sp.]|jgi:NhaC family Na+:H+ antiporter